MFPRLKSIKSSKRTYQYLVVSESVRDASGRSTTKDIATLGNVEKFDTQAVTKLIDGLARIFKLGNNYTGGGGVEILQALEHGNVILWQHLWNRVGLDRIIHKQVSKCDRRISIDVAKYVEMMVVNRCVNPLSKLATSRWVDTTSYAAHKDYCELSRDVELFYRSMDYLLKGKDAIEAAIYQRLRNLFSVNVKLTFYDITSTYFHSDSCPISAHGYSRDKRPELQQIVIGVLTSYEGYPLKHFVFDGNTRDGSTVADVVRQLKSEFQIEETTFVGDRGMISKLNLDRIEAEDFGYIMGVKHRQDQMVPMLLEDGELFSGSDVIEWRQLKIAERRVRVCDFLRWKSARLLGLNATQQRGPAWQDFSTYIDRISSCESIESADVRRLCLALGCKDSKARGKVTALLRQNHPRSGQTIRLVCALNEASATTVATRRADKLAALSKQLDTILAGSADGRELRMERVFDGHNRSYRRFFQWQRDGEADRPEVTGYRKNTAALAAERHFDGVFVLTSSRFDLSTVKIVESYKNLQEVETLFNDLKHFVDIRPVRHWLDRRVRAHVFLCMLALLLKRVYEIDCVQSKALTASLETIAEAKLVRYQVQASASDPVQRFWKVTSMTGAQAACFATAGIKNPESLEAYV